MAGHCWTTDVAACESLSDFLSVMTLDQMLSPDRTLEALDASETHGNKREAHLAMSADLSFVQQISILHWDSYNKLHENLSIQKHVFTSTFSCTKF